MIRLLSPVSPFIMISAFCLFCSVSPARAESVPLPPPLRATIAKLQTHSPTLVLPAFLGIPYRNDGTINDAGEYATFNDPGKVLSEPGLNCSGLVLAATRIVFGKNIPLAAAVRDRHNDSGPAAPLGQDWDFGFDLISNLADIAGGRLLVPEGAAMPATTTGQTAPSFDLHDPLFGADFPALIRTGHLYLVSFSRHESPAAPARLHYHVGAVVRDGETVWLYSTTRNSKRAIRIDLASDEGLALFRKSYRNTKGSFKRLTVVEIPL